MDDDLLATLATMQAHSDVYAMLVGSATGLGDYQEIARPPAGAPALVTLGTPFAFAVGMSSVHYRLSPSLLKTAMDTGATASFAGPQWMRLDLFRSDHPAFDLAFWCRKAYAHARQRGLE
jgi:hypothetical protein